MLGITRDRLGRFAKSSLTWKFVAVCLLAWSVWFAVHMFNALYVIRNSDGLHGIISRATYNALIDDHAKAHAYDTIPDQYLINQ